MGDDLSAYGSLTDHPMHKAIRQGDLAGVRARLVAGDDANIENFDGMVPLSTVAWTSGSVHMAKHLLEAGADPNGLRTFLPPLVLAAGKGHRGLVVLLLKSGADPNILDEDEQTALMWALMREDCELALELMSFGASAVAVDRYGRDARYYAEEAGCHEVIERIDESLESGS